MAQTNGTNFTLQINGNLLFGEVSSEMQFTTDTFETTVKGNTGTAEVASLLISGSVATAGNVTVTLDGVATEVPVDLSDTPAQVATKIRAVPFAGWATGGTAETVIFTANAVGPKTDATYSAGTTGATGIMTTTKQGVADTSNGRKKTFESGEHGATGSASLIVSAADGAKIVALIAAKDAGLELPFIYGSGILNDIKVEGNVILTNINLPAPKNEARTIDVEFQVTGVYTASVITA